MKIFKSRLFMFILGILLTSGVVYAANMISSSDVSYRPENNEFNVSNVKSALDELYTRSDNNNPGSEYLRYNSDTQMIQGMDTNGNWKDLIHADSVPLSPVSYLINNGTKVDGLNYSWSAYNKKTSDGFSTDTALDGGKNGNYYYLGGHNPSGGSASYAAGWGISIPANLYAKKVKLVYRTQAFYDGGISLNTNFTTSGGESGIIGTRRQIMNAVEADVELEWDVSSNQGRNLWLVLNTGGGANTNHYFMIKELSVTQ